MSYHSSVDLVIANLVQEIRDFQEFRDPFWRRPTLACYVVRHVRPKPANMNRVHSFFPAPAACEPVVARLAEIHNLDKFSGLLLAPFAFGHEKASWFRVLVPAPLPALSCFRRPLETRRPRVVTSSTLTRLRPNRRRGSFSNDRRRVLSQRRRPFQKFTLPAAEKQQQSS